MTQGFSYPISGGMAQRTVIAANHYDGLFRMPEHVNGHICHEIGMRIFGALG